MGCCNFFLAVVRSLGGLVRGREEIFTPDAWWPCREVDKDGWTSLSNPNTLLPNSKQLRTEWNINTSLLRTGTSFAWKSTWLEKGLHYLALRIYMYVFVLDYIMSRTQPRCPHFNKSSTIMSSTSQLFHESTHNIISEDVGSGCRDTKNHSQGNWCIYPVALQSLAKRAAEPRFRWRRNSSKAAFTTTLSLHWIFPKETRLGICMSALEKVWLGLWAKDGVALQCKFDHWRGRGVRPPKPRPSHIDSKTRLWLPHFNLVSSKKIEFIIDFRSVYFAKQLYILSLYFTFGYSWKMYFLLPHIHLHV